MSADKPASVKSLQDLYTVVVGLALSISVETLLGPQKDFWHISVQTWCLFGSVVFTLFPFYHGAIRHLDDTYSVATSKKEIGAVVDMLLLFLHALAFVFLALLLTKPVQFSIILLSIFSIDFVWGLFITVAASSHWSAETKWTTINFFFLVIAAAFLVTHRPLALIDEIDFGVLILIACVVRTVVDYAWCKSFYFPPADSHPNQTPQR